MKRHGAQKSVIERVGRMFCQHTILTHFVWQVGAETDVGQDREVRIEAESVGIIVAALVKLLTLIDRLECI